MALASAAEKKIPEGLLKARTGRREATEEKHSPRCEECRKRSVGDGGEPACGTCADPGCYDCSHNGTSRGLAGAGCKVDPADCTMFKNPANSAKRLSVYLAKRKAQGE